MILERFELARGRVLEIAEENLLKEPYASYFKRVALFLVQIFSVYESKTKRKGQSGENAKELKAENYALYNDILSINYEKSYANPSYSVNLFGKKQGRLLSFLYSELYCLIPFAFESAYEKMREESLFELLIRAELFLQVYGSYVEAAEEGQVPSVESVKEIIYWFINDYAQEAWGRRIEDKLDPDKDFAYQIIMSADLMNTDYLYAFGEYISENQLKTAEFLAAMDEKDLRLMADTYTEGYRMGFEKGNKDLNRKKTVSIVYPLGFERMVKLAISNFEKMGLRPVIMRTAHSIFYRRGMNVSGYYSEYPNRQFAYDHREDEALFLDKKLLNRKLEGIRESYEHLKDKAAAFAGPAWIEVFGEEPFSPIVKEEACCYTKKQQELITWYWGKNAQIINEYIKSEETSFTIIAFPIPEIGSQYEEIMKDTIALNTLNYETYEQIQQIMIDVLDKGDTVFIKGMNQNQTDLKIRLCPLTEPDKQTKFENCVADVNIPVGEIFTSPILKGTDGTLHVTQVYLRELLYKDLIIHFENGRAVSYSCKNFESEEENIKYIKDNVLFHYDMLPLGEFAIGTNTTAYMMAKKFGIQDKLPILIAEKTGPHFALGDTCYSHSEEVKVYNTDGKEMIAKDNEYSILRHTDIEKAYFQCHTDITIPYDEIGEISVVGIGGEKTVLMKEGRFVLPGTEKLNAPFDE